MNNTVAATSITDVATAMTYLLPGFVAYVLFYRTQVPGRPESDLVIAAKSLIWSLVIDVCFMWAVGLSPWIVFAMLMVAAVGTGFLAGYVVRRGALDWWWSLLGLRYSWRVDEWSEYLDVRRDPRFVFVHLSDGRSYLGWPERYSDDPAAGEKELVLTKTWLLTGRQGSEERVWLGQQVYIPLRSIRSIEKGPSVDEFR